MSCIVNYPVGMSLLDMLLKTESELTRCLNDKVVFCCTTSVSFAPPNDLPYVSKVNAWLGKMKNYYGVRCRSLVYLKHDLARKIKGLGVPIALHRLN
jgi:hypothetical protein